jgi:CPA2 family monovalent cation:H+ antiporter-2
MLFDPSVVIDRPLPLLATVAIIVLGKSLAAFVIVRSFGHNNTKALTIAASLAQIGEFSFILAALGVQLGVLPPDARDLILAGAIVSIFLNPFIFSAVVARQGDTGKIEPLPQPEPANGHIILVGYGRVGSLIAGELKKAGRSLAVIEERPDPVRQAKADGIECLSGNALDPLILLAAGIDDASHLLLAIPEGFEAGAICERACKLNPDTHVIARAHSDAEVEHLQRLGVPDIVMGEREIAARMLSFTARQLQSSPGKG